MTIFSSLMYIAFHPSTCQHAASGAVVTARQIASAIITRRAVGEQAVLTDQYAPRQVITLRDVFGPKRLEWDESNIREKDGSSSFRGGKLAPLHRLDRLQEVANLALEDRGGTGETWGCADIGTDHGLLAICLHANGASVVAGDRAVGPLEVARENVRLYMRHAKEAPDRTTPEITKNVPGETAYRAPGETRRERYKGFPRLECRLGGGLSVLKEGEVDTVCIAGIGVRTMIEILGGTESSFKNEGGNAQRSGHRQMSIDLPALGVRRLVLQPMDARLDYIRRLRVWLRENDWRITQETIVSTPGKGGKHAFVTIRADSAKGGDGDHADKWEAPIATVNMPEWAGGFQQKSDWLGDFLPARATDLRQTQDTGREGGRREAATFLAYLRHQRDWLSAIERARSQNQGVCSKGSSAFVGVQRVLAAVEEAFRIAGGPSSIDLGGVEGEGEGLATARGWRSKKEVESELY